jgi:hypothetical protein
MPRVQRSRSLIEPLVGRARSLHPALEAAPHRLRPLLPFGIGHPGRHEKLEDA